MALKNYHTGTIAVTNGSATVVGTTTLWNSAVVDGDQLMVLGAGTDWRIYEISVGSDTAITLDRNYAGSTGSGLAYMIFRNSVQRDSYSYVSKQLSDYLASIGSVLTVASSAVTITSAAALALAVGLNGATNPAFQVDASAALSATGIKVTSAAAAAGASLSVISSGTNENLSIDAKGSGTITLGGVSTGLIALARAATIAGTLAITSASASALAVGLAGATNPALLVDASTALSATGVKIKSAAAGGGVALSAISSGTNENIFIDAKGVGTISLGLTSTGAITLGRATTISGALTVAAVTASGAISTSDSTASTSTTTGSGKFAGGVGVVGALYVGGALNLASAITYGGVTLSNAVTGTGNMVLSASPSLTGTLTAAAISASGAISTSDTTASSSTTTGSGKFAGGVGIAGKLYVGDDFSVSKSVAGALQFTVNNSSASSSAYVAFNMTTDFGSLNFIQQTAAGGGPSKLTIPSNGTMYIDMPGSTGGTLLIRSTNSSTQLASFAPTVITTGVKLTTLASATAGAGLNMPHGAAPTSPVNGDIWTTTSGMFVRINGVTKTVTLT